MCLIKEKCDSTHERTGELGGCQPPPLRLTNFSQLRFFGQQKKFWQSQFLFVFFFFERDIC